MKLYRKYLAMLLKCQLQYKASFFLTALGQFLVSFTAALGVFFMFTRFHHVNGFTFHQVLISFSIVLMAFSLAECFARGFDTFPNLIRTGMLDRILVRPRNVIFQVLTSQMEFSRIGRLLQSVLMLIFAMTFGEVVWTFDKILTIVFMLLGGVCIFSGLFMVYAGISFFTIEGLEFMNIFTDGSREFGKYPVSIYGEGVLKFYTYVIPIALFQYYPFLYLVGLSQDIALMFLPLLGIPFLIPCYLFFQFGLRRYTSAGS